MSETRSIQWARWRWFVDYKTSHERLGYYTFWPFGWENRAKQEQERFS